MNLKFWRKKPTEIICYPLTNRIHILTTNGERSFHTTHPDIKQTFEKMFNWFTENKSDEIFTIETYEISASFNRKNIVFIEINYGV